MGLESLATLPNAILASQLLSAGAQVGTGISALGHARADARTLKDIGRISAADVRRQGQRVVGAQRAAYGAAGVDPGFGTPLEVMRNTAEEIELEALREKFRFDSAAYQVKREGQEALTRSILGATSTMTDALAMRAYGGVTPSKGGKRRRPQSERDWLPKPGWA